MRLGCNTVKCTLKGRMHGGVLTPSVVLVNAQVYRLYSESIKQAIVTGGPHTARSSFVKYMRR